MITVDIVGARIARPRTAGGRPYGSMPNMIASYLFLRYASYVVVQIVYKSDTSS